MFRDERSEGLGVLRECRTVRNGAVVVDGAVDEAM